MALSPVVARSSLYFPGQKVGGRFQILRMLGRGSVGSVLAARDDDTGEVVALKLLRSKAAGNPTIVERFRREALVLRELQHPGVVAALDAGALDDGTLFLAMEMLEGRTLHQRLVHDGPLTVRQLSPIVAGLCDALAAVHGHGILHRDIKPSNIFLPEAGASDPVKLVDFGIAKIEGVEGLTGTAMTVGTTKYMSPEQLRRPKDIDARTDVYAVGVCLYEALTGHAPFQPTGDLHIYEAILGGIHRPVGDVIPELPPAVARLVGQCLSLDMDARPAGAAELAIAWRSAAAG